ncbi:hypothetical protein WEI85_37005 [Actinomycetes bacterium KLBMP 9797]
MSMRRTGLILGALFLLAGGAAVVVPLMRGATADDTVEEREYGYACVQELPGGDDYCGRIADDLSRRGPVRDSDRTTAQPFLALVRDGFASRFGADCDRLMRACRFPDGQPDPDAVRAALAGSGFLGPVVRTARITDPAPADSVLYGVRAGPACLVGYVQSGFAPPPQVVGRLPDGTCLFP